MYGIDFPKIRQFVLTLCLLCAQFSSVQLLSRVRLSATPWTAARQASLSITNFWSLPKLMSIGRWRHPTISSSVIPFSSCLQSFPASGSFPMGWLFTSGGQTTGASPSASFWWIFRVDFLWDWLVCSPCSPKDSQESSPIPQFKSINYLTLSLLYGSTLTFVHDWWKNHSFDYTELCWQSDIYAF